MIPIATIQYISPSKRRRNMGIRITTLTRVVGITLFRTTNLGPGTSGSVRWVVVQWDNTEGGRNAARDAMWVS